ncbi:MAG TPA: maltotransferase domain-containing protein, partial [Candidatus Nanopelagicales bacterium]|nr:maltotransferase domain-containing protein [Candidatus Nanopelagicales bacterium]
MPAASRSANADPDAAPGPDVPTRSATTGRYAIEDVWPVLALGRRAVKAVVGEAVAVSATIVGEGHDAVGANVVLYDPEGGAGRFSPLEPGTAGTDRYSGAVVPDRTGDWGFAVQAWADPVATWRHRAEVKVPAGLDVELELVEGLLLLERALKGLPRGKARDPVKAAVAALRDFDRPAPERLAAALDPAVRDLLARYPLRDGVTESDRFPLRVERERALVGSWYEFFPRSEGATLDPPRSGTFATAAQRLPAIAGMGFDVVYLPPIHPIGEAFRKGPNNTLAPGPDDPGSPWAIGSA